LAHPWHAATVRYRDQPTIEVTQRVRCDVATAWKYVTDITLPARCSAELQTVEWLDDEPDKEPRIVARRLSEWQQNMQANLDWIRSQVEG
jgi:hypothetical protein